MDLTKEYLNFFVKEIENIITDREEALEKEKNKMATNDDIINELNILTDKKKRYTQ